MSNEEREGTGLDRYKILPGECIPTVTTLFIGMGDPIGFSDSLPSEWYEVSILVTHPPDSCPQDSVFMHAVCTSEPCRLRDASLQELPGTVDLNFTRFRP